MINNEKYRSGAILPNEVELAQELKISRNTLRQAINRLVNEGLLIRKKGVGTTVNTLGRASSNARNWMSFSQEMKALGITIKNYELHICWEQAAPEVTRFFRVASDMRMLRMSRVRGSEQAPIVYFYSYFNPAIGMTGEEDFTQPLYTMLEQRYGVIVHKSVEEVSAMLADEVLDPTHPARIGRIEGLAMLLLYVLSVWTAARAARREQPAEDTPAARPIAGWLMALMIVGGLAALVFGGEIFLHNAVAIARKLGVSESVIAITLVAGGTSLPELASSVVSVVKGRPDIALGNVVGSNIANILLILGLCSTVVPLTPGGIDAVTLGAVVLSSLLLFAAAFTFRRRALDRWEGVLFLAIYSAYLWWLLAK